MSHRSRLLSVRGGDAAGGGEVAEGGGEVAEGGGEAAAQSEAGPKVDSLTPALMQNSVPIPSFLSELTELKGPPLTCHYRHRHHIRLQNYY